MLLKKVVSGADGNGVLTRACHFQFEAKRAQIQVEADVKERQAQEAEAQKLRDAEDAVIEKGEPTASALMYEILVFGRRMSRVIYLPPVQEICVRLGVLTSRKVQTS